MHPKEYKKEKIGTGRMTHLQLYNSEIIVGVDFTENQRVNELLTQENTRPLLLYPGKESFNLSMRGLSDTTTFLGDNPIIFLLDGTWSCAKKMLRLSKNLQRLRRVSFDNTITSQFVIKQQPNSLCLSTIESVYTVLNLLIDKEIERCDTEGFLIPFEKMIAYQIECFLNPNNNHYRPAVNREVTLKDKYQDDSKRSIIYEQ